MFYSNFWVINKTSVALWYQAETMQSSISTQSIHSMSEASSTSTTPTHGQTSGRFEDIPPPTLSHSQPNLYSDGENTRYFNGIDTLPVMLDCPRAKLRVMPYGHVSQSTHTHLIYASNIQVKSGRPYRMKTDFGLGMSFLPHSSETLISIFR